MNFPASRPLPLAGTPAVILLTPSDTIEFDAIRMLFREYASSLDVDLGFQNFEEELTNLPGDYDEPRGALLLALVEVATHEEKQDKVARTKGNASATHAPIEESTTCASNDRLLTLRGNRSAHVAGCCALKPLDTTDYPNAAEMKRLYVRPAFRNLGLGRQLAESILDAARGAGYSCVLLDTVDDMESARALYEDLGFEAVPPYYHNPLAGSHYLKVDL